LRQASGWPSGVALAGMPKTPVHFYGRRCACPIFSMSKTKQDKKPADDAAKPADGGWRETVESIAMAVILALLFRGFVAEAFVIPTGSMAPTLQGRHKDVQCPKCFVWY
jgi:hypothetical protein